MSDGNRDPSNVIFSTVYNTVVVNLPPPLGSPINLFHVQKVPGQGGA